MGAVTASDAQPSPLYSVRAAAARAGVPTATVRSWNRRYDIGPQHHSAGRHRLYTESDVAVLKHMVTLIRSGARPASAARTALASITAELPAPLTPEALIGNAGRLDAARLVRDISANLRAHGVVSTWEHSLRPAFARIDARQQSGEECIDIEHTLSWAAVTSLRRIESVTVDRLVPVLLACVDGDLHTLPMEALRAALAERGRTALMLGSLPPEALATAIRRNPAAPFVVLWAQRSGDQSAVSTALATGAALTVAGPGWEDTALSDAVGRVGALDEAVALLTADQARSSHGDADSDAQ